MDNITLEKLGGLDRVRFIVAYLHALEASETTPQYPYFGLCYNLERELEDYDYENDINTEYTNVLRGYHVVDHIAPMWPEFSGDAQYPIPGGCKEYDFTGDKWEWERGKLRRSLCGFIGDYLNEMFLKGAANACR